jgi:hypothetical protein
MQNVKLKASDFRGLLILHFTFYILHFFQHSLKLIGI